MQKNMKNYVFPLRLTKCSSLFTSPAPAADSAEAALGTPPGKRDTPPSPHRRRRTRQRAATPDLLPQQQLLHQQEAEVHVQRPLVHLVDDDAPCRIDSNQIPATGPGLVTVNTMATASGIEENDRRSISLIS